MWVVAGVDAGREARRGRDARRVVLTRVDQ